MAIGSGYNLLLSELLKDNKDYAATPLYQTGRQLGSSLVIEPPSRLSPASSFLVNFLSHFAGGTLQNLAKSSQESNDSEKYNLLADALSAPPEERDKILGLNSDAAAYSPVLKLIDAQDEAQRAEEEAQQKRTLAQTLLTHGMVQDANGVLATAPGYTEIQAAEDAAKLKLAQAEKAQPTYADLHPETRGVPISDAARELFAQRAAKIAGEDINDPAVKQKYEAAYANQALGHLTNALLGQEGLGERATMTENRARDKMAQVGEKEGDNLTNTLAIADATQKQLDTLRQVYKTDPGLAQRAIDQLPLGSDAYNAFQLLTINGARAAKSYEGRVNDTTLQLYTDLVTPRPTEPLATYEKRVQSFVDMTKDDANTRLRVLAATKRDTSGLQSVADSIGRPPPSVAPPSNSYPVGTKATLKNGGSATWDGQGWVPD